MENGDPRLSTVRPMRYSELRTLLPTLSDKVLTDRLRDVVSAGLVVRRKSTTAARAELYALSEQGNRWARSCPDCMPGERSTPRHSVSTWARRYSGFVRTRRCEQLIAHHGSIVTVVEYIRYKQAETLLRRAATADTAPSFHPSPTLAWARSHRWDSTSRLN